MQPADRAVFVAAYSRLVAEVWADPEQERLLGADTRALLAQYGLRLPDEVAIEVVRAAQDTEPDLNVQVSAWEQARDEGRFTLFVPSNDPVGDVQLAEYEL